MPWGSATGLKRCQNAWYLFPGAPRTGRYLGNVFLRGLVNACVIREQEGCALWAYRDFDEVFQKYPRKYPPQKSDGYVRNGCRADTCTR